MTNLALFKLSLDLLIPCNSVIIDTSMYTTLLLSYKIS